MTTLDTLSVRFEADAAALFGSLDTLERRLEALRQPQEMPLSLSQEIETRLTVTADEAVSRALEGAGQRLAQAVSDHETAFGSALAAAERSLAEALRSAVSQLEGAINITVPVSVDGARLATATLRGLRQQSLTQGRAALY